MYFYLTENKKVGVIIALQKFKNKLLPPLLVVVSKKTILGEVQSNNVGND